MVGLPDGIRSGSLSAMNQFESVAVRFGAFVGESDQIRWQASDDVEHGTVARSLLAKLFREP